MKRKSQHGWLSQIYLVVLLTVFPTSQFCVGKIPSKRMGAITQSQTAILTIGLPWWYVLTSRIMNPRYVETDLHYSLGNPRSTQLIRSLNKSISITMCLINELLARQPRPSQHHNLRRPLLWPFHMAFTLHHTTHLLHGMVNRDNQRSIRHHLFLIRILSPTLHLLRRKQSKSNIQK